MCTMASILFTMAKNFALSGTCATTPVFVLSLLYGGEESRIMGNSQFTKGNIFCTMGNNLCTEGSIWYCGEHPLHNKKQGSLYKNKWCTTQNRQTTTPESNNPLQENKNENEIKIKPNIGQTTP